MDKIKRVNTKTSSRCEKNESSQEIKSFIERLLRLVSTEGPQGQMGRFTEHSQTRFMWLINKQTTKVQGSNIQL